MREAAFDELHGFLDGHVAVKFDQQVNVIGHDDEVVQLEFVLGDQRTQHIDQQARIAFSLKETPAHAGAGGCKEVPPRVEDVF